MVGMIKGLPFTTSLLSTASLRLGTASLLLAMAGLQGTVSLRLATAGLPGTASLRLATAGLLPATAGQGTTRMGTDTMACL